MSDRAISQLPQLDNDLRVVVCPACGYSLVGLPDEGTCPECGRPYDQSAIHLHGWACGKHADLSNATPRAFIWKAVVLLAYALWMATQARAARPNWGVLAVFGLVVVDGGFKIWQRFSSRRPGLAQVRLDADGCAQDDAPADVSAPAILQRALWIVYLPVYLGAVVAVIVSPLAGAAVAGYSGAALVAVVGCYLFVPYDPSGRTARFRRFFNPARPRPPAAVRWPDVKQVRVDPLRARHVRLRITGGGRDVVDVEAVLSLRQVVLLQDRIDAWRRRAAGSHFVRPQA